MLIGSLLPAMCVAYITQSLDKGTTGATSIMGWPQDLGMKGQDYALTSTFLWIGIIVGEPIVSYLGGNVQIQGQSSLQVNQFIRKFPVAKVLGISMVVWSAVSIPSPGEPHNQLTCSARLGSRLRVASCSGLRHSGSPRSLRIQFRTVPGH